MDNTFRHSPRTLRLPNTTNSTAAELLRASTQILLLMLLTILTILTIITILTILDEPRTLRFSDPGRILQAGRTRSSLFKCGFNVIMPCHTILTIPYLPQYMGLYNMCPFPCCQLKGWDFPDDSCKCSLVLPDAPWCVHGAAWCSLVLPGTPWDFSPLEAGRLASALGR